MCEGLSNIFANVKKMLGDFTESYVKKESQPFDLKFAFLIDEIGWFSVNIFENGQYKICEEKPDEPVFYFKTDFEILKKIHSQEMTAYTAMGAAKVTDITPLMIEEMEGAKFPENFNFYNFLFRYFVLGYPEKIKFGKEYSRIVHDGYSVPIIYNKGLRSAWYRVEKGMKINNDDNDQSNPFDTVVIGIKGSGIAKLDDVEHKFMNGDIFFIPSGMRHTFWSGDEEGLEFIILMYGEKA